MARRLAGFSEDGDLVPEEVAYLREVYSRLRALQTRAAVVRWMAGEGFVTTAGNPWTTGVLTRTMLNPRLAGLDSEGNPIEGAPVVITPEERQELLALLAPSDESASTDGEQDERSEPEEREWLLAGPATVGSCGLCASPLTVFWAAAEKPIYRCPPPPPKGAERENPAVGEAPEQSCGRISMSAPLLERGVAEQLLAELLRPEAAEHLEALLADVIAEIARLREHRKKAERHLQRVTTTLRTAPDSMRAGLLEAQKAAQKEGRDTRTRLRYLEKIVDVSPPLGDAEALVAWWEKAPLASKRALVALEIIKVSVGPGRRGPNPNPHDRIDIAWS
ncbi:hypothetical protein [Streptomyces sp. NPDC049555]|uniref:hypothetical protein n=1 Tax=Streptomyces sp. NPDC049555 TaxID=3154930 RepID=UPI003447902A